MPAFIEEFSLRGLERYNRVNPAQDAPLPRLSLASKKDDQCYEVVIIGSGPAGMMATILLARFGIGSVLTVDEKPRPVKSGQADGLQPRTLEVLQSLDLANEILTQGCQMCEIAFWNPKNNGKGPGIERMSIMNGINVPSRYPHGVTIHQGRIEKIFNDDLESRGKSVDKGWKVTDWRFDYTNADYPILVNMESTLSDFLGAQRQVRAKFLIGADGARSTVRCGMGESLVGDHTDHVWGVVDSVLTTNFPDIRKKAAIHSPAGSIMIIPRERISHTEVLTRVYCQMEDAATPNEGDVKINGKTRREKVTLERIISQTTKILAPYSIEFGEVDWWAAYQIGQRVAPHFSQPDASGLLRVHIVGDACHTHSPKAGQGMNVSMMDAYNLAWKLAHVINGLAPNPNELLATYELERLNIARQLIEFDAKISNMYSGKIGEEHGFTHEDFVNMFITGAGFTSGCGIEYSEGLLVKKTFDDADQPSPIRPGKPELGLLVPGRRVMNVKVKRFADANPRDIHDDMPSNSRYRIILILPISYTTSPLTYFPLLSLLSHVIPSSYPHTVVETLIIHPYKSNHDLEWDTHFPPQVKASVGGRGEWLVFGDEYGEVYERWGVDRERGAVVVVRPDGYVGIVGKCDKEPDVAKVEGLLRGYLDRVLVRV